MASCAIAGLVVPDPVTVAVNHFGAVATLEGLRPLLSGLGVAARGCRCLARCRSRRSTKPLPRPDRGRGRGRCARARRRARRDRECRRSSVLYTTSKLSIARWVRTHAATDEWARAGIALNAVAPGVILTPMTAAAIETEEGRAALNEGAPAPLRWPGGPADRGVQSPRMAHERGKPVRDRPGHLHRWRRGEHPAPRARLAGRTPHCGVPCGDRGGHTRRSPRSKTGASCAVGGDGGNRTSIISLEGRRSTIELHPRGDA